MESVKLIVGLALLTLFTSCATSRKTDSRYLQNDSLTYNRNSITTDNERLNCNSTTVQRSDRMTESNISTIANLTKRVAELENVNVKEVTYYESGNIQSEKQTVRTKQTDTNAERITTIQITIKELEHYIDSLYIDVHNVRVQINVENERLKNIISSQETFIEQKSKNIIGGSSLIYFCLIFGVLFIVWLVRT